MRYLVSCLVPLLMLVYSSVEPASVTNPPAERDLERPVGSLEGSGFDIAKIRQLSAKLEAGEYPNTHMVLVEYDGKLVYEKYLSGNDENLGSPLGMRAFDAASRHDLRSVSKSVTSLVLGIALGEDFEAALSRPIIEYFPELEEQVAPGVEKVTLHHVLTMTAGFEWNEMDLPYSNPENDGIILYRKPDPVQYALTRPLRNQPGESWYYNGGMTMVVAALIEQLSGKPFLVFAREALAEPLGISDKQFEWRGLGFWWQRPSLVSASDGLRLRARDLAKIRSLVLHDGNWQGRQIVPKKWIRFSTRRHTEQTSSAWSRDGTYGYGYQWWHGNFEFVSSDFTAPTGVGYGGQRLFVIPSRKIVVTVFAGNYGIGKRGVSENILFEILAAAPSGPYEQDTSR